MTEITQILLFPITILLFDLIRLTHQTLYTCDTTVSCGCSKNETTVSRIVGGEDASSTAWGWAVSIAISGSSLCGGSIISSSVVVTAAHCAKGRSASQFVIYAGSNSRWTGTQTRTVSSVIIHSAYDSNTFVNDIALLKLSSPLILTDPHVSAICLPIVSQQRLSSGEWPPAGTNVSDLVRPET